MARSCWSSIHSMATATRCAIIERDGHVCCWCLRLTPRERIQLDHIRPRRPHRGRPGKSTPANIVLACADCNRMRGNGEPGAVARFRAWLADFDRTIADGMLEAKRRTAKPLDRVAGRALARQWYPNRLEYLSRAQRAAARTNTTNGRGAFRRG